MDDKNPYDLHIVRHKLKINPYEDNVMPRSKWTNEHFNSINPYDLSHIAKLKRAWPAKD